MAESMVNLAAEGALYYLNEKAKGGVHTDRPGNVLVSLAQALFGEEAVYGTVEYHYVSKAVIWLEENDFVIVTRKNHDEPKKANVVLRIELKL